MDFVETNELTAGEKALRDAVFVAEQGFAEEYDELDGLPTTHHLVLYENGEPLGCCRWFPGKEQGEWIIGRVAVRKDHRRASLASKIVTEAERRLCAAGARKISLGAQCYVKELYEKLGFKVTGPTYYDEAVEHVWMSKEQ